MIAEDCFGYLYSREEEVRKGRENYKEFSIRFLASSLE
jgi:hypothetical protein